MTDDPDAAQSSGIDTTGLAAALGAYGIWGFSVLFFKLLGAVPATEVIAHRVVWTVVFVGFWLAYAGRIGEVRAALSDRAVIIRLAASTILIATNWLIFVWSIGAARVLEVSFGYFINPLVSVAIGFALLGERFSKLQATALAVAILAIGIQATGLSQFPWISLALAFSFAVYGFIRKTVDVKPSPGLFVETLVLAPVALGYLLWISRAGYGHFLATPGETVLLAFTGILTALPLILFATGARRLPLSTVGILQYLAPSIHFLLAVFAFGEPLSPIKLASFVLIWISLAIFAADMFMKRAKPL